MSAKVIHKAGGRQPSLSYPEPGILGLDLNPGGTPKVPMFLDRLGTKASSTYTDIDVRVSRAEHSSTSLPTRRAHPLAPLIVPAVLSWTTSPRFHRSAKHRTFEQWPRWLALPAPHPGFANRTLSTRHPFVYLSVSSLGGELPGSQVASESSPSPACRVPSVTSANGSHSGKVEYMAGVGFIPLVSFRWHRISPPNPLFC